MNNQFRRSKKEHIQDYEDKTADAPTLVRCACCMQLGSKRRMDRHHIQGRHGENMSNFEWLCRSCHTALHDDPEWAEEIGLMIRNR